MKKIKITLFIILLGSMMLHAQTREEKGLINTYIIEDDSPGFYIVYNKNNIFTKTTPSYLLYEHTPPITVGNKYEFNKLVYSYFVPYFKKYGGDYCRFTALIISLFSDISGTIKDVRIAYPVEVGIIPINVIEEFEAAVLKSNVKLVFDKNLREFNDSAWVGQYAAYNSDKLRDYVETESPFSDPPPSLEKK